MPRPIPVFAGTLVRLRPADPERDAEGYRALYGDARLVAHVRDRVPTTAMEARAELERLCAIDTISLWLITASGDGAIVGRYFLTRAQGAHGIVVGEGVRVAPCRWRTGVHREARRLLTAYAFETLGAERFATRVRLANANMIRAAEAYGFERTADVVHEQEPFAVFELTRARYLADGARED